MIDILLLAELAWCTVWLRRRGLSTNLFYAGGMLAAGYAAMHLSGWLAGRFISTANPAFLWLQNHLTDSAQSVTTMASLMPSIPATTGLEHSQWIALHLVKSFFFLGMTAAIFVLFAVMNQLMIALWDRPSESDTSHPVTTALLSTSCGLYVCILTVAFTANLAWIRNLSMVGTVFTHSESVYLLVRTIHFVQGWILP